MKFFRYLFLLLFPLCLHAQETTLPAQQAELATYLPSAASVKGLRYTLEHTVHSYYKDPARNEIILLLKKDKEINIGTHGELVVFNMDKGTVKWRTGINTFRIFITAQHIITSEKGSTHCYLRVGGKQAWSKMDATVKYVDEAKGIVLTDYIRGLNLHSGKTMWQRYLPARYNWEDLAVCDDSSVVIATGGLYKINLYTGKGWSSASYTSRSEYDVPEALGIVPPVPAYLGERVPEIKNQPDVWRSTTSNLVLHEGKVYHANNTRLICADLQTGDLLWSSALVRKTGISKIAVDGPQVILANTNTVAPDRNTVKRYGMTSYLMWLNLADGASLHNMAISMPYDVRDVSLVENEGLFLYDSAIARGAPFKANPEETMQVVFDSLKHYSFATHPFRLAGTESTWFRLYGGNHCMPYDATANNEIVMHTSVGIAAINDALEMSIDEYAPAAYSSDDHLALLFVGGRNRIADKRTRDNEGMYEITFQTPEANRGFIHNGHLYIVDVQTISVIPLQEPK